MFDWLKNLIGSFQGFSACHHCHGTWNWKKGHTIPYRLDGMAGMFPLCEECYEKLSPQERYKYCIELYDSWGRPGNEVDFEVIAEYVGLQVSWVQDVDIHYAHKVSHEMTKSFHEKHPDYSNKEAYYVTGKSKHEETNHLGIYFIDVLSSEGIEHGN